LLSSCRLRSLSDSGGALSTDQYKLAEHRYGREDLLALYKLTDSVSPDLRDSSVMLAKPAPPLALVPMSDEEQVSNLYYLLVSQYKSVAL